MNALQQLLPHIVRWNEVSTLVKNILQHRIDSECAVMAPWVAGGGYELGSVIGVVPGSSSTLLYSAVLNDQDWSHAKVSQEFGKSCAAEFGDAMAAANFLEIQRTKGDSFNVNRIMGIGITATIATTNPEAGKRGGQRAYISLRRANGMKRIGILFQHSSEYDGEQEDKRKLQSQIIDLVTLNLIADSLGIEQVALLDDYRVTVEEGSVVEVDGGFVIKPAEVGLWDGESLDDTKPIVITAEGELADLDFLNPQSTTLIPCSANPFTPAHDEMALHIQASSEKTPVFVLNINNAEKGTVDLDEVLRRARAFVGRWPVLIVQNGAFVEMAEDFYCDFALGADTAVRIFLPKYCSYFGGMNNVYSRLKATGVKFTVFPRRNAQGRIQTKEDVPSMYQDLFLDAPDIISRISSTAIRNSAAN